MREEAEIFRRGGADEGVDLRELVANHALLQFDNVILTRHMAYYTDEALRRL